MPPAKQILALLTLPVATGLLVLAAARHGPPFEASAGLAFATIGVVTCLLAVAGWRHPDDVEPRNVAAVAWILSLPLLGPLVVLALSSLQNVDTFNWLPIAAAGGVVLSLFGFSVHAHPMPGVTRTLLLAIAWIVNLFAAMMILAFAFSGLS